MSPTAPTSSAALTAPSLARWAPLLLVLATLLTFSRLTRCEFTYWDDPSTVALNPDFNPPTAAKIAAYWTQPHMGLYVPVTYTVWGALAAVAQGELPNAVGSRLKPSVFHTANVLLHLLMVLVVYRLLLILLEYRPESYADGGVGPEPRTVFAKSGQGSTPRREPWPALAGALLFALHPVQVEAVGWASGLKDVLCGLLVAAAVWQYLRHAVASAEGRRSRPAAVLATVCFVAAMLSKPTAITAPLIAVALDVWVLRRPLRRTWPLVTTWALMALPIMIVTGRVQTVGVVAPVATWLRPLVAGDALAFYLRRLAAPAGFVFDYGRRPEIVLGQARTYFIWVIPAALAAWVWAGRRRRPWLLGASTAALAPLLPLLGLRPFMMQYTSTVTDHYLYQPMVGVAIAFAFVVSFARSRGVFIACTVLLASLGVRSFVQAGYWRDDETLCRHCLAVNPDSFPAHLNLGHDLEVRGEFAEELHEFTEAVRCNPNFPLARGNCAVMQATLGHMAEAEHECRELMRLAHALPTHGQQVFVPTYAFVGRQLLHRGKVVQAIPLLTEALRLDPRCDDAAADIAEARSRLAAVETD